VPNPLVPQGTLNRVRASVIIPGSPELNITASFLGRGGVSLGFGGDSTTMIPTMTGMVTSPEPYKTASLTIALVRSQNLAALYKAREELNSLLGDITIIPDTAALPNYQLLNCALQSVRDLPMSGDDAGYVIIIQGTYLINASLWEAV